MLLLLALACGGGDKSDTGEVDDTVAIEILSPADDATVPTCFPVAVEIRNFQLVDYRSHPDPVDGEGHWILDFGDRYFVCEELTCDLDISGAEAGGVDLRAVLVGNDHNRIYDSDGAEIADAITVQHAPEACHAEE